MTNERLPEAGLWDADEDDDDDEQTQVAPNPLLRGSMARVGMSTTPASDPVREGTAECGSSEGRQPVARRSLYERLLASGALDDVADDEEEAAREPVPLAALPAGPPCLAERALADPSEPPCPAERAPADPAYTLGPARDGRDSSEPLRDSDIDFVSASVPVSSASDLEVHVLEKAPATSAVDDSEQLRASPSRVATPPSLPSVMLSPQLSTRFDITERVALMPRVHPLADSVSPPAVAKSEPPGFEQRTPWWHMAVAAAALLGVAAGVARFQLASDAQPQHEPGAAASGMPRDDAVEIEVARKGDVQPADSAREPAADEPLLATQEGMVPPAAPVPEPQNASGAPVPVHPTGQEKPHGARRARASESRPSSAEVAVAPTGPSQPASARPSTTAAPEDPLPEQPTREQVVQVMEAVLPRLKECAADKHGLADVTVTVRSPGFVSYALVGGAFAGTPEGSCIARVVKWARFPAFSDPFIRVTFPYQL